MTTPKSRRTQRKLKQKTIKEASSKKRQQQQRAVNTAPRGFSENAVDNFRHEKQVEETFDRDEGRSMTEIIASLPTNDVQHFVNPDVETDVEIIVTRSNDLTTCTSSDTECGIPDFHQHKHDVPELCFPSPNVYGAEEECSFSRATTRSSSPFGYPLERITSQRTFPNTLETKEEVDYLYKYRLDGSESHKSSARTRDLRNAAGSINDFRAADQMCFSKTLASKLEDAQTHDDKSYKSSTSSASLCSINISSPSTPHDWCASSDIKSSIMDGRLYGQSEMEGTSQRIPHWQSEVEGTSQGMLSTSPHVAASNRGDIRHIISNGQQDDTSRPIVMTHGLPVSEDDPVLRPIPTSYPYHTTSYLAGLDTVENRDVESPWSPYHMTPPLPARDVYFRDNFTSRTAPMPGPWWWQLPYSTQQLSNLSLDAVPPNQAPYYTANDAPRGPTNPTSHFEPGRLNRIFSSTRASVIPVASYVEYQSSAANSCSGCTLLRARLDNALELLRSLSQDHAASQQHLHHSISQMAMETQIKRGRDAAAAIFLSEEQIDIQHVPDDPDVPEEVPSWLSPRPMQEEPEIVNMQARLMELERSIRASTWNTDRNSEQTR